MANDNIITINDLTELPTAGTNDYLIISSGNNTYKIKASAVGGGGGGADDFVVNFTITPPDSATSATTFAQIKSAYDQGKNIKGIGTITGMGDLILYPTMITDTDVVFFGFFELEAGAGIYCTLRGNSSGYSFYMYQ